MLKLMKQHPYRVAITAIACATVATMLFVHPVQVKAARDFAMPTLYFTRHAESAPIQTATTTIKITQFKFK